MPEPEENQTGWENDRTDGREGEGSGTCGKFIFFDRGSCVAASYVPARVFSALEKRSLQKRNFTAVAVEGAHGDVILRLVGLNSNTVQMACEELIYVNYEHDTDAVSVGSLSTAVSLCAAVSAGMREMSNS